MSSDEGGSFTPPEAINEQMPEREEITTLAEQTEGEQSVETGFRPKEFIQTVEGFAMLQATVEKGLEKMKMGEQQESEGSFYETALYSDTFSKKQIAYVTHSISEFIRALPKDLGDRAPGLTYNIGEYANAVPEKMERKHETIKRVKNRVQEQHPELKSTSKEFNVKLAQTLIYEDRGIEFGDSAVVLVQETPIGVSFLFENIADLNKAYDPEKDVTTKIDGFETTVQITFERDTEPEDVAATFQQGIITPEGPVGYNKITMEHEMQHAIDMVVAPQIEALRFSALYPYETSILPDRRDVELPFAAANSLKMELLAYGKDGEHSIDTVVDILADPKGTYNFEGILGTKEDDNTEGIEKAKEAYLESLFSGGKNGKGAKQQLSEREKYIRLIIEGAYTFQYILEFYQGRLDDQEIALSVTANLLSQFPVQDWASVNKMLYRYSSVCTKEDKEHREKARWERWVQRNKKREPPGEHS